uniref:Prophage integrase IntS n=2 Tax=Aliivibrio wodanis TaxID=80852 RepID=A0A5Q4ZYA4_9GAMM|nr:Prophage integrase IntS [Aliivibrio wodanis]
MFINKDELLNALIKKKTYEFNVCTHVSLSVHPSGSKTLLMRYRIDGKKKCLKIGNIELFSNEELNQRIRKAKQELHDGTCPATRARTEIRKNKEGSIRIEALIDYYSKTHVAKLKSADQINALLNRHLIEKIGYVRIAEFNQQILETALANVGQTTQRKVAKLLHAAFNFAISRDLISMTNPMSQKVNNFGRNGRKTKRYLKKTDIELLLENINNVTSNKSIVNAVLLLVATGQRKCEILEMRWDEVDFNNKEIVITAERLKTAHSEDIEKQEDHTIFLSDFAITTLKNQLERTGTKKNVFNDLNVDTFNRDLTKIIKKIEQLKHFTPHDLRRTFFTNNLESGYNVKVLDKILNHKITGVESHYNYAQFIENQKEIMKKWGVYLSHFHKL